MNAGGALSRTEIFESEGLHCIAAKDFSSFISVKHVTLTTRPKHNFDGYCIAIISNGQSTAGPAYQIISSKEEIDLCMKARLGLALK